MLEVDGSITCLKYDEIKPDASTHLARRKGHSEEIVETLLATAYPPSIRDAAGREVASYVLTVSHSAATNFTQTGEPTSSTFPVGVSWPVLRVDPEDNDVVGLLILRE